MLVAEVSRAGVWRGTVEVRNDVRVDARSAASMPVRVSGTASRPASGPIRLET